MKHVLVKISFYFKKFGLGAYHEKMPMVFPYTHKISIQLAWIECCIFLIKKNHGKY